MIIPFSSTPSCPPGNGMPFFVLIILGGLQSVSSEILESAHLDGCNWFTMTFRIKLPMIINHISVAIMPGLIFLSKEYGLLILVTTAGGPGKSLHAGLLYTGPTVRFQAGGTGRVNLRDHGRHHADRCQFLISQNKKTHRSVQLGGKCNDNR